MFALTQLHTFVSVKVGVNRATCDSVLSTEEGDRKKKRCRKKRGMRGDIGGVGAGTERKVYG